MALADFFDMGSPLFVVTGANGFIGRYFVQQIHASGFRIRALIRDQQHVNTDLPNVEWVVGDITEVAIWEKLLEPGCIVVNLAYSQVTVLDVALKSSRIMAQAFLKGKIRRLVHCSTIDVYGYMAFGTINELTSCKPINQYGLIKLEIDKVFLESQKSDYDVAILRPSQVFGMGGQALISICNNISQKSQLLNYFRKSLFGYRRLHLVPVETVAFALQFLCMSPQRFNQEVFIISEDENPSNNYYDVENVLREVLEIPAYVIPPILLPHALLKGLLRIKGSAEVDPDCYYSSSKLKDLGFVSPVNLLTSLRSFAAYYKQSHNK